MILIDFSKVISPIGISKNLANNLSKYLILNQNEIRKIYKSHISDLVTGKISINIIIDEMKPFLNKHSTVKSIIKQFNTIPILDKDFLDIILILKKKYKIIMVSDIYEELGDLITKRLTKYFDDFIFSYKVGVKKSDDMFWQILIKEIKPEQIKIFIDDKEENINIANKYGINGLIFKNLECTKDAILKISFNYMKNIVLGGGASGILFTYFIEKKGEISTTILEKENEVGGLIRSYKLGESYFDIGGHALHDNNKKIKKFLNGVGLNHFRQRRRAFIDYDNKYIPFPFQLHLKYLRKRQRERAYKSFIKAHNCKQNNEYKNLKDFLKRKFGKIIYKLFLKNYNKKIWKTPLRKIAINRKDRISVENIKEFEKGYKTKNDNNYGNNNFVNYPVKGGFQEYIEPFKRYVKQNIKTKINIKKIDIQNKLLYTQNDIYHYDNLISTIPLNSLLTLLGQEGEKFNKNFFEYLGLQIMAFLIPPLLNEEKHRIYEGTKKYNFHKCVLNSNSSQWMKDKDEFIIAFESSYKRKITREIKYKENCIKYMIKKGYIDSKDSIKKSAYKEFKYAYPIQTLKGVNEKIKVRNFLKKYNIFLLGRFGNREYINFDKVIENSFKLANELKGK